MHAVRYDLAIIGEVVVACAWTYRRPLVRRSVRRDEKVAAARADGA
jgi:hypothetical protein